MRHFVVRRTALLLGAVFVGCAGLFVWLVSPAPAVVQSSRADGARLFQAHCASCHGVESLQPGADTRRSEMARFLAGHGGTSDEEDLLILDYVAAGGER